MTDDPFAAFKEGTPPAEDQAPKKTRKKRAARPANGGVPTDVAQPSASSVSGAETKKRGTRKARKARELKLPLSVLINMGALNADESEIAVGIISRLQDLPKKSRTRVASALMTVFA